MKKIFKLILITLIISSMSVSTYEFVMSSSETLVNIAKEFTESYYRSRDLGDSFTYSCNADEKYIDILSAKIELKAHLMETNNFTRNNYSIDVITIESSINDDVAYFKFQVITTYNYSDVPTTDTTVSDIIEILIDTKANKIIDVYQPYDFFDHAVRGEGIDLLNEYSKKIR